MAKKKVRYVGPSGYVNNDVARDTGRGGRLESDSIYEVSESLAASLALSADWEPVSGTKTLAKQARIDSRKRAENAPALDVEDQAYPNHTISGVGVAADEDIEDPQQPSGATEEEGEPEVESNPFAPPVEEQGEGDQEGEGEEEKGGGSE